MEQNSPKYNYYIGDIYPEEDIIFVFGSNPVGINGNPLKGTGGAALFAQKYFGVRQGEKMNNCLSSSGRAYGLVTVTYPGKRRSLLKTQIIDNIRAFYNFAVQYPDKRFMVAYKNVEKPSLNGYTGIEMSDMFKMAGNVPENVYFSINWKELLEDNKNPAN